MRRIKFQTVFDRGVYVDENTSQAAKDWRKSPKGFFDKLKPEISD